MGDAQSKRLRLRFFPEDDRAVDETLKLTTHTSKSNVIRAALAFFDQVWFSKQSGFRVAYARDGNPESASVLDAVSSRGRGAPADGTGTVQRPKTEKSIEIRVTRSDKEKIDRLLATEAADTFSAVVRRAIRVYACAVARCLEGWEVVSVSPSGDVLPVAVPGLGTRARAAAEPVAVLQDSAGTRGLSELLPRSLMGHVRRLAASEGCSPEMLLVDMVRMETLGRLNLLREGSAAPEASVDAVEEAPASAEPPQATVAAMAEADQALIADVERTLDEMADSIENVMRLVGEATRSKSQQAQFSDLLFDAGAGREVEPEASGVQRLFARARALNERLSALVALTQRKQKEGGKGKG